MLSKVLKLVKHFIWPILYQRISRVKILYIFPLISVKTFLNIFCSKLIRLQLKGNNSLNKFKISLRVSF